MMIGIEEINEAMRDLTPGGLKLFLYLSQNVDSYKFWFSPTDVQKTCNMSKSTYDRARQELLQKGYLKQDGNQYNFFANKQDAKEDSIKLARKLSILVERIKDEGGNIDKYEILKEKMSNIQDSNEKIRLVKEYCEIADRELNDIYNKKIEEKLNI